MYVEALAARIVGQPIERLRLASPFLVRTFAPPIRVIEGKTIRSVSRIGKRIVFQFDRDDLYLV